MQDAHSDHGTVLNSNEAALVIEADGGAKLYFPQYKDDEEVPRLVLFLAAVMTKIDDDEWVDEILSEAYGEH